MFGKLCDRASVKTTLKECVQGSGCGSVGRAVASIPEDPGSNPVIGNFY